MDKPILDWVNLPSGVEPTSLWAGLHDAHLIDIRSDLLARTLEIDYRIQHINHFHHWDDDTVVTFTHSSVSSVRCLSNTIWPGSCDIPAGLPASEKRRIVQEYQAKWRQYSVDWLQLEQSLHAGKYEIGVSDGALVRNDNVAMRIEGFHNKDDMYHELYIYAETVDIRIGHDRSVTMEEFLGYGQAYWDAFENEIVE